MKSILVLTVFALIIAFSAGSAVAESNPLLTVFEAVEVGMKYGEVIDALFNHESYDYRNGRCCLSINTEESNFVKAKWFDLAYGNRPGTTLSLRPVAELEIVIEGSAKIDAKDYKIVKIIYRYKFLNLNKELVKK